MNSDLMLVVGLVVAALSLPSLLNAWSEGRAPRAGAILVMIAIGLIVAALQTKPGGYQKLLTAPFAEFAGDKSTASWLLNADYAKDWQQFQSIGAVLMHE